MGKKITLDAAAEELGVARRTMYRFITTGQIQAFRVGKRLVRVDADDVAAMLRPIDYGHGHGGDAA